VPESLLHVTSSIDYHVSCVIASTQKRMAAGSTCSFTQQGSAQELEAPLDGSWKDGVCLLALKRMESSVADEKQLGTLVVAATSCTILQ
jgi:hypothetical protein